MCIYRIVIVLTDVDVTLVFEDISTGPHKIKVRFEGKDPVLECFRLAISLHSDRASLTINVSCFTTAMTPTTCKCDVCFFYPTNIVYGRF